jgi:hypothetical protein
MALLVHIAPENEARDIARHGIRPTRWRPDPQGHPEHDRVVWAFPVLDSYTLTHSWSRELKRWGRSTLAAFTFRIADQEPVYASHFSGTPLLVTAAEAVGIVRAAADARGYEIMVPRRIDAAEIVRWRVLPRAIGWRFWPGAKNLPMRLCDCPMCIGRGEVKANRYRNHVRARMRAAGFTP